MPAVPPVPAREAKPAQDQGAPSASLKCAHCISGNSPRAGFWCRFMSVDETSQVRSSASEQPIWNVQVSGPLNAEVDEAVRLGIYATKSELVRQAVREHIEKIRPEIARLRATT